MLAADAVGVGAEVSDAVLTSVRDLGCDGVDEVEGIQDLLPVAGVRVGRRGDEDRSLGSQLDGPDRDRRPRHVAGHPLEMDTVGGGDGGAGMDREPRMDP